MASNPPVQHVFAPGRTLYSDIQALADGINWANGNPRSGQPRRPYFFLQQAVAQAMGTSGTDYPILFDTEIADTDNGHSTSTNTSRYTAQTSGLMLCLGVVAYNANATGNRRASFRVNGSTYWWNNFGSAAGTPTDSHFTTAGLIPVSSGDYVELVGRQTSGGSLNTATSLNGSLFAGVMLTA